MQLKFAILGFFLFCYSIDRIRPGVPRLDVIGIIDLQLASAPAECSGSPLSVAFIDRVGPHHADSIESFQSAVPW